MLAPAKIILDAADAPRAEVRFRDAGRQQIFI